MPNFTDKIDAFIQSTKVQGGKIVIVDPKVAKKWMGREMGQKTDESPLQLVMNIIDCHENSMGGRQGLEGLLNLKDHVKEANTDITAQVNTVCEQVGSNLPPLEALDVPVQEIIYEKMVEGMFALNAVKELSRIATTSAWQGKVIKNVQNRLIRKFCADGGRLIDLPTVNSFEDAMKIAQEARLTHLNLACMSVTDKHIHSICENLSDLNQLVISSDEISDSAIIEIANNLKSLTHLNVSWCEKLTDSAIFKVANNLKSLTHLDVSACRNLTDSAIFKVANNLESLTHLTVIGCHRLTHSAIIEVANNLKSLTYLDVKCLHLTDSAIKEVAKNLKSLTYLGVTGCVQLTDSAIKEVAAKFPSLVLRR